MNHRMFQPSRLGLLLEAQLRAHAFTAAAATLDEALALSAQTGEQVWAADLYRLQGELLHASSAPLVAVIAAFEQAIALGAAAAGKNPGAAGNDQSLPVLAGPGAGSGSKSKAGGNTRLVHRRSGYA